MSIADVVYGIHPVTELLQTTPKRVTEIHLAERKGNRNIQNIVALAQAASIPIRNRPHQALGRETNAGNHQGVVAMVSPFVYAEMQDLLEKAKADPQALIIFGDSIQDPHNLGAIVRSAHAMGAIGVIIPRERSSGVTHTVERASAGATAHMPICQVVNLARTLDEFFEVGGLWMTALAQGSGNPIWRVDMTGKIGIVVGNEGKGIRPNVLKRCHHKADIPLSGRLESLNASVATGIALYEVLRQRGM